MEPKKIPTHRLLISGILLAVLFDILLYGSIFKLTPLGLNLPLYVLCFYLVMKYALRDALSLRKFPAHIIFIAAFSLPFALYNNAVLLTIDMILLVLLIGEHLMLSLHQNLYGPWTIFSIGDSLTFWFGYSFHGIKGACVQYGEKEHVRGAKGALIGIAVALPAAAAVTTLLHDADLAFGKLVDDVFAGVEWGDIVGYAIVGVVLFFLVSGLVWSAANQRDPRKLEQPTGQPATYAYKPFVFNGTAAIIVAATLDVILALFSLTQFLYLFAGRVPEGMTYAEYARSGFYQLLAVSLIVLLLIFLIVRFGNPGDKNATAKRVLLTLLCAFTFILLVSAFARMVLYEQAYNFTIFRIFTQFFMVALGIILILTALYLWIPRLPIRKTAAICTLACYAVLALMNLDGFIARENVRYQQKDVDIAYLATLSCDALPYYIDSVEGMQDDIRYQEFEPSEEYALYTENECVICDYQNNIAVILPDYDYRTVLIGLAQQKKWLEKAEGWQYLNAGRTAARPLLDTHKELFDSAQSIADLQSWW